MRAFFYRMAMDQAEGLPPLFLKPVLWALSKIYLLFSFLARSCYLKGVFPRIRLERPVISVGNVTWGGVGKTPLVEYVALYLSSLSAKPVVLLRGYGGKQIAGKRANDESRMLEQKLLGVPVLVGPDRAANARAFLAKKDADVFVMDDGFQHWRLKRDLDIVAVDATNPWGNGNVIPRGILREPLTALKRAEVVILTKTDLGQENVAAITARIRQINPQAQFAETIHAPQCLVDPFAGDILDVETLKGKTVGLICSIGNPRGFARMLENLGARICGHHVFPDHHRYDREDVRRVVRQAGEAGVSLLITTAKDAVKLKSFQADVPRQMKTYYLDIAIKFVAGEEKFRERIDHLLQR